MATKKSGGEKALKGNLRAFKRQVSSNKQEPNSNKYKLPHEREVSQCISSNQDCIYYRDNLPECNWLRQTGFDCKCKHGTASNRSIGVDSRKIKFRPSRDDERLRAKVRKYLKVAEKIERERRKMELRAKKRRLLQQFRETMNVLSEEKIDADKIVQTKGKYDHLTTLI